MRHTHLLQALLGAVLTALPATASAIAVNVDFNHGSSGDYSGQGSYADPGNDFWNTESGNAPSGSALTASDGTTATTMGFTSDGTGNHQRSGYSNLLLRDGAVHPSGITISGLDAGEAYDIYCYSTFDAFATTFAADGKTAGVSGTPDTNDPYQENLVLGETYALLSGVHPDASGNLLITISNTHSGTPGAQTFVTGLQVVGDIPLVTLNDTGVVNVDFGSDDYSGQGAHADPGNDFWNGGTGNGYSAFDLTTSDGSTVTTLAVSMPNEGIHTRGGYANSLLKDGLVTTGEATMYIDYLDNSSTYSLTLYGTFDEYSFDFTADAQTTGISGTPDAAPYEENLVDGQTHATLTGLQTDGAGTIEITLTPTGTTGKSFVTGFQIARESASATSSLGRVLCIGDSITESNSLRTYGDGNWSWRYWFWENLVDFSVGHQMVGTRNSNKNGDSTYPLYQGQTFDKHHDSIWGTTAQNRAANAPTYLGALAAADQTPDTAVVFVGGNDFGGTSDPAVVNARVKTIIDHLQGDLGTSGNPDIRIVVISILPRFEGAGLTTPKANNPLYTALNALLEPLTASETTATSEVTYLDLVSLFSTPPGLLYDGTHPNGPGEQLIGNAVFAELVPDMPPVQMRIESVDDATGQIQFKVRTHGPQPVRIDTSPDLSNGSWSESLPAELNPGEWTTMTVTESPPLPARLFYRAVTE